MAPPRRDPKAKQPAQDPSESRQISKNQKSKKLKAIKEDASLEEENTKTVSYFWRQYGGLIICSISCLGTVLAYRQEDEARTLKTMGWLLLAILGLVLHELRPFKIPMS